MELVPRYPQKTFTNKIKTQLEDRGFETTLRTVQRDLHELSRLFPIVCDETFLAIWLELEKDAEVFAPAMDPIQALTFCLVAQYLEPLMPKLTSKELKHFQSCRKYSFR